MQLEKRKEKKQASKHTNKPLTALKLINFIKNGMRKKKKKNVEDYEIAEIVHKIPTLPDNEVDNTEGNIPLEVSSKSLKNRI